jgi:riboflavin kinase / FMN adenylyltransferase
MSENPTNCCGQVERVPSVITPGNHDGVHLGHRALLNTAKIHGAKQGLRTVALTFDPHPTQLLAPDKVPPLLTTIARRCELLKNAGADEVIVQHFGEKFAALSPEDFMRKWLIESLDARALVVGPNFGFGKKRSGNIETLRELGKKYGCDVLVVEPIRNGGEIVSSSAIRRAIIDGDLDKATRFLDRFHDVSARVVEGDKRGRTLGFPTANLECTPALLPVLLPPDGVYAVVARQLVPPSKEILFGVANIGVRPTFQAGRSVEVHFFDFDKNLYGIELRVGFVRRIRKERTFENSDELRKQIQADALLAREWHHEIDKGKLSWL